MTRQPLLVALVLLPALIGAAPRQNVAVRAYINVSSGCQTPTVDFLNGLKARYAPNTALEIIDFGDAGDGLKRWQQSGHRCMTIELNGSPLVKFPVSGKTRAVAFQMPAGLNWTHADLEQAVQAGLQGQLQAATPQDVEASQPARQVHARVTTAPLTYQGKKYAAVKLDDTVAMAIPVLTTQAATLNRAATVAQSLRAWLAKPVKPSQLVLKQTSAGWAVMAGSQKLITATAADGKAVGKSTQALAQAWLAGVKYALVQASN